MKNEKIDSGLIVAGLVLWVMVILILIGGFSLLYSQLR